MAQITKDVVQWLQQWFYTEAEVDAMIPNVSFGFDSVNEELYVEVL